MVQEIARALVRMAVKTARLTSATRADTQAVVLHLLQNSLVLGREVRDLRLLPQIDKLVGCRCHKISRFRLGLVQSCSLRSLGSICFQSLLQSLLCLLLRLEELQLLRLELLKPGLQMTHQFQSHLASRAPRTGSLAPDLAENPEHVGENPEAAVMSLLKGTLRALRQSLSWQKQRQKLGSIGCAGRMLLRQRVQILHRGHVAFESQHQQSPVDGAKPLTPDGSEEHLAARQLLLQNTVQQSRVGVLAGQAEGGQLRVQHPHRPLKEEVGIVRVRQMPPQHLPAIEQMLVQQHLGLVLQKLHMLSSMRLLLAPDSMTPAGSENRLFQGPLERHLLPLLDRQPVLLYLTDLVSREGECGIGLAHT